MKKTIAIIAITSLSGCVRYIGDGDVVTNISGIHKAPLDNMNTITCNYENEHHRGTIVAPCTLYHVGDTIRVK